jgi:glucose-6-phosphate isomerase, archaeal
MDWATGGLQGPGVESSVKRLGEIRSLFHDQLAASQMDEATELYRVQVYAPVEGGTEGGLFWGNTVLQPGKVGDEYFMTKGHFHKIRNRAEYYATQSGEGGLLLMEENGSTRCEWMRPGSVHYIPGHTAHRVANTGTQPLVFVACWPSDAGYDYQTIEHEGFTARLLEQNGVPQLVSRGLVDAGN